MTITAQTAADNRTSAVGNGVTTSFAFGKPFTAQADLVVNLVLVASPYTATLQVLNTDYTITGTADAQGRYGSGGNVVFSVAPSSLYNVVIYADPACSQSLDLVENDPLPAEQVELALDKGALLSRRFKDLLSRVFRLTDSSVSTGALTVEPVASQFLGFDASKNLACFAGTTATPVSTYAATVLLAATAAAARTTLGAAASGANADITSLASATTVTTQAASDNSTKIASTAYTDAQALAAPGRTYLINGSFAVNQRVTMPTADNSYFVDRWRLLLGAANAATVTQDTADVPTAAKYAVKLVVGAGNNNKFGIFQPIEGINVYDLRGQTVSILVPLKATAGLVDGTGKIRIGIAQWTGTEDAISATPISAWGAEGTNPTLIAGWAFANTPAALSVTTSWADYTVLNVAISATAVNLGVLIWSDDKVNTQTTDILRVGGYVTLVKGASVSKPIVNGFGVDLALCQRYYEKSFDLATAPAQNVGANTGEAKFITGKAGAVANTPAGSIWFKATKRATAATITLFNPAGTNALVRNLTAGADSGATATTSVTQAQFAVRYTGNAGGAVGDESGIHWSAESEL